MEEQQKSFNQIFAIEELKRFPNDRKMQVEMFEGFYRECVSNDKAPFISDFIIDGDNWGCVPLIVIAENEIERAKQGQPLLMFKLRCLCDERGKQMKTGDVVTRLVPSKAWKQATPKEENSAKQRGQYNKIYKVPLQYEVDEKGCINVPFTSASYFIQHFGVHHISRAPITTKKKTTRVVDMVDGKEVERMTLHYWRFMEITDEEYSKLPTLKK